MLTALSIRNVVLIESLDLDLAPGLTVLTGETGAGKSILLDALGLALGGRADRSLVGPWADRAQVVATFSADRAEDLARVLEGQGLDVPAGEELSLRRVLGADGRSRAFVNDQPVGRGCLEALAAPLLEIHGQRASFALLDASQHRRLLDRFGGHEAALTGTAAAFARWRAAREALETLRGRLSDTDGELAYLRAGLAEIEALAPRAGEEEELAALRARQGRAGRVSEELADALRLLGEDSGPAKRIGSALRRIERVGTEEPALMAPVLAALERTLIELQEAEGALAEAARACRYDEGALEAAEARLFALRALARKHRVTPDALPVLAGTMRADIERLESGEATLGRLEQETAAARAAYEAAADHLSALRAEAGARLDAAVAGELAPLRLEKARFRTALARETDGPGAEHGRDRVRFEVSTNPGRPFGPLSDVASGGEFARFVLALKVVLGAREGPRTFIFDEVDQGVGGAVADAVGERLARLAQGPGQLFVVTHSPQVAARGTHHLRVEKTGPAANDEQGAAETALTTRVVALDAAARLDEIARMLSGAEITEEARAAAARLLGSGRPPPPRRKRTGTG